jgi:hypothetical protein
MMLQCLRNLGIAPLPAKPLERTEDLPVVATKEE